MPESKTEAKPKVLTAADLNDDPSLVETLTKENAESLLHSGDLAGGLSQRVLSVYQSYDRDTNDGD